MSNGAALGGCGCLFFAAFMIVLISVSVKTVDQMENCLRYNWLSNSVDEAPYTEPGMHWVGWNAQLVCYPNFNQYVYFRGAINGDPAAIYRPPIHVRTSDGLSVNISMEFVYTLPAPGLQNLYLLSAEDRFDDLDNSRRTNDGYKHIMMNLAEGALDNKATEFTANQFYNDRIGVQIAFLEAVSTTLSTALNIEVGNLQLQPANFPEAFANSIIETQVQLQDQFVADQEQITELVQKQTALEQAQLLAARARVEAEAEAARIQFDNEARISQFSYRQQQDARGYKFAYDFFDNQDSFMSYMSVRAMTEHSDLMLTTPLNNLAGHVVASPPSPPPATATR